MKPQIVLREKLPNGDVIQYPGCYEQAAADSHIKSDPKRNLWTAVGYVHKGYQPVKYPFPEEMRLTESDRQGRDLRFIPCQKPGS